MSERDQEISPSQGAQRREGPTASRPEEPLYGADLLKECAEQFRFYEAQHRAKNTSEADVKAEVNAALANRIEHHLRSPASTEPPDGGWRPSREQVESVLRRRAYDTQLQTEDVIEWVGKTASQLLALRPPSSGEG
jgi:hypothetical protein